MIFKKPGSFVKENYKLSVLCLIAMIVVIGFSITGCNLGFPLNGNDDKIIIRGTLSQSEGMSRSISARTARNLGNSQRFSGEVKSDNTIEGLLEDGDMTFRLKGMYDPSGKMFSMHAASSMFVFSISGALNNNNNIDPIHTQAAVHVKDAVSGEWDTIPLNVMPSNQNVGGSVNQTGGVETPAWSRGL